MDLSSHAIAILAGLRKVAKSELQEAFTIPPAAYSDAEIHELEQQRIFKTEWLCAGLATTSLGTFQANRFM
jgi:hypothetical protein